MNQDHEPLDVVDGYDRSTTPTVGGRRWLRATAVAAVVGAGALGSWALSQPSNSSAAESATEASDDSAAGATERGPGRHGRGPRLDAAAATLGLSVDELRAELKSGATLAEVAEAQGVEVDALIAAIVADVTTDIDAKVEAGELDEERAAEIKAGLVERVTAMVNGEFRVGRGGPDGHGPGSGRRGGMHLDTAAEVLGLTADELRSQLRDGNTLAEVATAQDVDVDTLIDALVADARDRIVALVNGEAPADAAEEAAA